MTLTAPPFASFAFAAPSRRGPSLGAAAYTGFLGEFVRSLEATTEADPAAILATTLSMFSALVGPNPHLRIGDDRHPFLVNVLVIGHTSTGRKGTSSGVVRRVFRTADNTFVSENVVSGLSSGEGLVFAVRDPEHRDVDDDSKRPADPGVLDKRLFVIESEFGVTMRRSRREGNTLAGVLRQAWDGTDLHVLTKMAVKATAPHIAITGHITPGEFRAGVLDVDLAAGTYNRFLPIWSERVQLLAEGGGADDELVTRLAGEVRARADKAGAFGRVVLHPTARDLWCERIYKSLNPDDHDDGPVTQFTARATAQCLRVAMGYALFDAEPIISGDHLRAAHAVVDYAAATARHVFGDSTGNTNLDKLLDAIRKAGTEGLTRSQVSRVFSNHLSKQELDDLLDHVCGTDGFVEKVRDTGGRPLTLYLCTAAKAKEAKGKAA